MPVDSHFTHHRNHHPDAQKEVAEVVEVAKEEEEDSRLQQDPAYSHHMDKPPILTSS
jgi:hypothetical protein